MNAPWSGSPDERIVTFAWIWRNRIRLPAVGPDFEMLSVLEESPDFSVS
jgi:hypothetical protein